MGQIDVSCLTGQTSNDANRTQSGPLNHHRDYPLSYPRGCQLQNSREHPHVSLYTYPKHHPDHNSNYTGQLILLQREQGRSSISISHIPGTWLRGAAQARQSGQEYTGRSDKTGATEATIESKYSKSTTVFLFFFVQHHQFVFC